MTPENPMGKKSSPEYNASARKDFENDLKKLRYEYIPILGSYGNVEKVYFIANVNIKDMDYLGHLYDQESFIYAEKDWTKDYEKSFMNFSYYEKGKQDSPYKERDTQNHITLDSEAKDFFTSLKSYKFNIPFSIFEKYIPEANSVLNEKYGFLDKKVLLEGILNNIYDSSLTIKSRWKNRCFLYESLENKILRCKKLKEASIKNPDKARYLPDEVIEMETKGYI